MVFLGLRLKSKYEKPRTYEVLVYCVRALVFIFDAVTCSQSRWCGQKASQKYANICLKWV